MPNANRTCSDEEIITAHKKHGGNRILMARELRIGERQIYKRLRGLQVEGVVLPPSRAAISYNKAVFQVDIKDGVVLIGSDAHYWPDEMTTTQRAFQYFVENYEPRPRAVVMNGDVFDGSRISRHPKIGFLENAPSVKEELEVCERRLTEIEDAVPKGCKLVWPLGNHDLRYESYLAANAPEMRGVSGMHLKDRFPKWQPCWVFWINPETPEWIEIKHRFKGGIHAARNNTVNTATHTITGHLHNMQISRVRNRHGRRWGVDAGTMADIDGEQFIHYTEANNTGWESGFVVLTIKDGRLLKPELVIKWDETHVEFRGQLIEV